MSKIESTLIMIKPDAMQAGHLGKIIDRVIQEHFSIRSLKQKHLTLHEAQSFYIEHKARPFYGALTTYMSSHPIVIACITRDQAINYWREVIGATDPAEADENTIRKRFGKSKGENAVHGSDAPESAQREISFFFSGIELA